MTEYVQRLIEPRLQELISLQPAIMITGPRAVGKTTTAKQYCKTHIDLSDPTTAADFNRDPFKELKKLTKADEPILIDEWQEVKGILWGIKSMLDEEARRPGRFIITGSVSGGLNDELKALAGGRCQKLNMYGLNIREAKGTSTKSFLQRLIDKDSFPRESDLDKSDYLELALKSTLPKPFLTHEPLERQAILNGWADFLNNANGIGAAPIRSPEALKEYIAILARYTATNTAKSTLRNSMGVVEQSRIDPDTANRYEWHLKDLMIYEEIPAWKTPIEKRKMSKKPKRYLVDAGLVAAILNLTTTGILNDDKMLGQIMDTFVLSQFRTERQQTEIPPEVLHLRDQNGRREVDIVFVTPDQKFVGIEVKAAGLAGDEDAKHLIWLAEQLGKDFLGGAVLHTGHRSNTLHHDYNIQGLPISTLWTEA